MSLTILCVTSAQERALPFLGALSHVAKEIGAEIVIAQDMSYEGKTTYLGDIDAVRIPVFTKGFVEPAIDEAKCHCSGDYILRIDDDERISPPMEQWLRQRRYLAADHWSFPRAWIYPEAGSYIADPPHWEDHQTRLSVRAKVGGLHSIHSGSPYGGGTVAPVAIEHYVLTEKSYEDRVRHVENYDRLSPGAGSNFKGFYLPEGSAPLVLSWNGGWAPYAKAVVSGVRRNGPHMEQHDAELWRMLPWLLERGPVRNVLEIGTNNGGTAALWCEIADHVTSVDLPDGPYGSCNWGDSVARNGILSKRYAQFRGILGDSHTPAMLEAVGAAKLDLLFIDADHTYGGVRQDFEMYSGLVKSGGIVLFHDIVETGLTASMQVGVGRFWRELKTRFETKEFSINADWGGLGALVIP